MGQLSSTNQFLNTPKRGASVVWQLLRRAGRFFYNLWQKIWGWLTVHIPFLRALVARHLNNPATIFVDIAVFVLVIYIIFGITGGTLIYAKRAESRFAETLAILYPMPAARVDSTFIWSHKFLQRLRFLTTFNKQIPADQVSRPPTDAELREKIMEGLIEDQIILIEAKKNGVSVSEEELDASYNEQKKVTTDFEAKIRELYGMSVTEFRSVLAERILKEKVKGAVLVRVRVRHILTTTQSAANEAKRQLDSGRPFADVAKEYSQDKQSKDAGGELGYWSKGELSSQIGPGFEETSFALEVNKPSGATQSQFGFHIIEVTEKTGTNFQTYEDWYKDTEKNYKIKRYLKI